MKTRPALFAGFPWRWFLAAAAMALGTITEIRAVDLSGTYENFGSMINPEKEADAGPISLQGLFSQDFDYKLTRVQHAHIDRVVVQQSSDRITIECRDTEGKMTWSGQWKRGAGYITNETEVGLMVRAKQNKDDSYLFSISSVSDQHLLMVAVNYIQATAFGPVAKPLGAFLFSPQACESRRGFKIHPGKREELNPAFPPAPLPDQPPAKQTSHSALRAKRRTPLARDPESPASRLLHQATRAGADGPG